MSSMQRKNFFLDGHIRRLQQELVKERNRRVTELSTVVKSLLRIEQKLRFDKKVISQKLRERDAEICRLVGLNKSLRSRAGNDDGDGLIELVECAVPEALMCRSCRREFYEASVKDGSSQTCAFEPNPPSLIVSSDEDNSSVYEGLRNNVSYMSKRTKGTFQHYKKGREVARSNSSCQGEETTSNSSRLSEEVVPVEKQAPAQEFEISTDDWYASASENEEMSNLSSKQYGHSAINPVLECVNQILLQQSMDEHHSEAPVATPTPSTPIVASPESAVKKRVHFSTKNSLVHVPSNFEEAPPIASSDNAPNYESIYSNEYEPIGSENNTSNLYVDMDAKSCQDRFPKEDKSKKPPALPPKPANLIKFDRKKTVVDIVDKAAEQKPPVEPDYCSISEMAGELPVTVQIVADVHKIQSDSHYSYLPQDDVEEILSDIPKLPNVAAIMAPKTPPIKTQPAPTTSQRHQVPKIPFDFSIKRPDPKVYLISPKPLVPAPSVHSVNSLSRKAVSIKIPIDLIPTEELPLQDEFDWYNLDAEFANSYPSEEDVIEENDDVDS